MKTRIRDKKWFPWAIAACIPVTLFVALTHLDAVKSALGAFLGHFSSIFLGCVMAYLINPLAGFFARRVLKKVKKPGLRWTLAVVLAFVTLFLIVQIVLGTLIPQLFESVTTLQNNMEGYIKKLQSLVERLGVAEMLNLDDLVAPSGNIVKSVVDFLREHAGKILNFSSEAGKSVVNVFIALILSVYLLLAKDSVLAGVGRLARAVMPRARYEWTVTYLRRCDRIVVQYIAYTLLDALIVGSVNAAFMACCGMEYVGLVSLVVGLTNLIPNFGPVIGWVLGGFILLLVKPLHALMFLLFSFLLQFLDSYVIKPKLFGNSLGVSGLLIMVAVVVFGSMFGVVGMLVAIPLAAIIDFTYREEILPALERRQKDE